MTSPSQNTTESRFRHPFFDLRGTRKVQIRHANFHSSRKKNLPRLNFRTPKPAPTLSGADKETSRVN